MLYEVITLVEAGYETGHGEAHDRAVAVRPEPEARKRDPHLGEPAFAGHRRSRLPERIPVAVQCGAVIRHERLEADAGRCRADASLPIRRSGSLTGRLLQRIV